MLIITHYSRILRYMSADRVHVMIDGRIVRSGGPEVAEQLEAGGYERLRDELGVAAPASDGADPFADLP
jgi:Fe-S cluster assembly ATP-binding protein